MMCCILMCVCVILIFISFLIYSFVFFICCMWCFCLEWSCWCCLSNTRTWHTCIYIGNTWISHPRSWLTSFLPITLFAPYLINNKTRQARIMNPPRTGFKTILEPALACDESRAPMANPRRLYRSARRWAVCTGPHWLTSVHLQIQVKLYAFELKGAESLWDLNCVKHDNGLRLFIYLFKWRTPNKDIMTDALKEASVLESYSHTEVLLSARAYFVSVLTGLREERG